MHSSIVGNDAFEESGSSSVLEALDCRMNQVIDEIRAEDFWQALVDPATPQTLLAAMLRDICLEIASYQPHVIEATIAIIGRMPKREAKMIQRMLIHQAEESDHGCMAWDDFVTLGGDPDHFKKNRISPASFAVASCWWGLWRMEDPFAYLGALYPFEGITPVVTAEALEILRRRGFDDRAMSYVSLHATEDIKHQNLVRKLISYVAETFPESIPAIHHGMECFLHVYPIPVWRDSFQRVVKNVTHATAIG